MDEKRLKEDEEYREGYTDHINGYSTQENPDDQHTVNWMHGFADAGFDMNEGMNRFNEYCKIYSNKPDPLRFAMFLFYLREDRTRGINDIWKQAKKDGVSELDSYGKVNRVFMNMIKQRYIFPPYLFAKKGQNNRLIHLRDEALIAITKKWSKEWDQFEARIKAIRNNDNRV